MILILREGGVSAVLKLKMNQHHTAFFENQITRKAEEAGGELQGLAPFYSFLEKYYHHFHVRSRPSFKDRAAQYLSGLFQLDCKRNIEKIYEKVKGAEYQSIQHLLTDSPWNDDAVCAQVAREANDLPGGTPDSCLIIDPSGVPKKGLHSVGVTRQYCGNIGKVDNCQVGVFAALGRGRDFAEQCSPPNVNKEIGLSTISTFLG